MRPARWRLIPHFLLRRAGFPFATIEALANEATAEAAMAAATAQARAEEHRSALLREHFPREVSRLAAQQDRAALRALSAWRKQVGRGRAQGMPEGPWEASTRAAFAALTAAHAEAQAARARLEAASAAELPKARAALRAIFREPAVREALFLLSPDLLATRGEALGAEPSPTADASVRALEKRLYAFAQRLAAKNETTSFFGPLAYGEVEPFEGDYAFGPELPGGVSSRRAFFAFWAAAAVGKAAAADPALAPSLPLRRVAAASAQGEVGLLPDGRKVALPADAAALFEAVDDRSTLAQLAAATRLTPEAAERAAASLLRAGFLRRDLEPLSTTSAPLEDVRAQLPATPAAESWRALCDRFAALLVDFAAARLPERAQVQAQAEALFEERVKTPARRAAGQTYADRTILYEDCLSDLLPLKMSRAEAERIEAALGPALDLGATYGALRHRAIRALAAAALESLGGSATFLAFADQVDQRVAKGELAPLLAGAEAFLAELGARVSAKAAGGTQARFSPEELAPLVALEGAGRFASPDLMLQRCPAGEPRYVIGEVHPYVFAWGSQNQFAPDPRTLQAAFREDLSPWGGPERLATVLRRRRHKGLVSDTFPGTFVEVTGRSVEEPARRVPISALKVARGPNGPVLLGPRGELTLYTGEDDHPHLRAFAPSPVEMPPLRLGAHTPRVVIGELVLIRERWAIPEQGAPEVVAAEDGAALAVEVARLRRSRGIPRHVFAHSPSEPKPLCLDLACPWACAHLRRLLGLGRVALTEMLPGPAALWLGRAAGGFTSELRMAMVRQA